jgi:hypothetical protein
MLAVVLDAILPLKQAQCVLRVGGRGRTCAGDDTQSVGTGAVAEVRSINLGVAWERARGEGERRVD